MNSSTTGWLIKWLIMFKGALVQTTFRRLAEWEPLKIDANWLRRYVTAKKKKDRASFQKALARTHGRNKQGQLHLLWTSRWVCSFCRWSVRPSRSVAPRRLRQSHRKLSRLHSVKLGDFMKKALAALFFLSHILMIYYYSASVGPFGLGCPLHSPCQIGCQASIKAIRQRRPGMDANVFQLQDGPRLAGQAICRCTGVSEAKK